MYERLTLCTFEQFFNILKLKKCANILEKMLTDLKNYVIFINYKKKELQISITRATK